MYVSFLFKVNIKLIIKTQIRRYQDKKPIKVGGCLFYHLKQPIYTIFNIPVVSYAS